MKKTIILACALLATVAAAQDIPTTTPYFSTAGNTTLSSKTSTFTWDTNEVDATLTHFALSFSVAPTTTATADVYYLISMNGNSTRATGLSVAIDNRPDTSVLTLTNGSATWYNETAPLAPTIALTSSTTYTLAVLDGKAYLWQGSDISEDKFTNGWTIPTDVDASIGANNDNRVWTTSSKTPVTLVQLADISAYAAIPEPATATLSLLALAGLAARRRRA